MTTDAFFVLLDKVGFTVAGFGTVLALGSLLVVESVEQVGAFGQRMSTSSDVRASLRGGLKERAARWLAYGGGTKLAVLAVLVGVVLQLP